MRTLLVTGPQLCNRQWSWVLCTFHTLLAAADCQPLPESMLSPGHITLSVPMCLLLVLVLQVVVCCWCPCSASSLVSATFRSAIKTEGTWKAACVMQQQPTHLELCPIQVAGAQPAMTPAIIAAAAAAAATTLDGGPEQRHYLFRCHHQHVVQPAAQKPLQGRPHH